MNEIWGRFIIGRVLVDFMTVLSRRNKVTDVQNLSITNLQPKITQVLH